MFSNNLDTSTTGKLFESGLKEIGTNALAPNGTGFFSLTPGSLWDVYVYTASEQTNQNVNVSLTGAVAYETFYFTGQGTVNSGASIGTYTGTYVQALNTNVAGTRDVANYVKWSNVAPDANGSLIFNFAGTANNAAITGFQITQVPEPSAALFALAGMGMLGMMRRRPSAK